MARTEWDDDPSEGGEGTSGGTGGGGTSPRSDRAEADTQEWLLIQDIPESTRDAVQKAKLMKYAKYGLIIFVASRFLSFK